MENGTTLLHLQMIARMENTDIKQLRLIKYLILMYFSKNEDTCKKLKRI